MEWPLDYETRNMEADQQVHFFVLDSEGYTLLRIMPGSAGFEFQPCKDLSLKPSVSKSLMTSNMKKSNKNN